jgi:hypothetical protein
MLAIQACSRPASMGAAPAAALPRPLARRSSPRPRFRPPPAAPQAAVPGEAGDVGFKQAMQQRWLALDKSAGEPWVVRKVESISDRTQELLQAVADGQEVRAGPGPAAAAAEPLNLLGGCDGRMQWAWAWSCCCCSRS